MNLLRRFFRTFTVLIGLAMVEPERNECTNQLQCSFISSNTRIDDGQRYTNEPYYPPCAWKERKIDHVADWYSHVRR